MRNIINKIMVAVMGIAVLTGCEKVGDLPAYADGNAVVLSVDKTSIAPTPTDSVSAVITFSWTSPKYAADTNTFKYVLEIDSSGRNFSQKATRITTGALSRSLTGKDLNGVLLNYGFTLGTPYELDVRVISSYANNNERYTSNVIKITVSPYSDPAVLSTEKTSVTGTLATASTPSNTFSWTNAFNGYSGNVTYVLQYDSATKNFANAHDFPVGVNMFSKNLTQGEMNQSALDVGIPGGNTGKVEYRLKATTAQGAVSYSNTVSVTIASYMPIVRMYLPGGYQAGTGNGNNWDPPTAPEFIRDTRAGAFNNLYYLYIYLPAGAEFKITQGRSWDINFGGTGGNLSAGGANLTVASAGFYRISVDRTNLKYDIREGRMGYVGDVVPIGWTPGSAFPAHAMGTSATNLFVGITDFTTGGWKMIDSDTWNNGDLTVVNTRSYGSTGGSGSPLVINDANMPNITSAGRYRVIWDGRGIDNIKYEMSPATEMRVVGNGIQGVPDWNPGASPQMTYSGNGVWTITLTLVSGKDIKFLAGNDWGAFDYEDNSGGSTATGTPRKIKWEGGDNFKTPGTTGSYTITLNEHTQTVTIN